MLPFNDTVVFVVPIPTFGNKQTSKQNRQNTPKYFMKQWKKLFF